MSYKCDNCKKTFNYEYLLLRHKNRKTPCKYKNNISEYIDNINNKIKLIDK